MSRCRVCNARFYSEPLLLLKNMPSAAQNLPDISSLPGDRGIDLEIHQCSGCGLVQLSNKPVPYYKEVIRASAFSGEMREFRLKQFRKFVEDYDLSGKKVIEIGCGKGEYLSLMKKAGCAVHGVEYSDVSVKHCVENDLNVNKFYIDTEFDRLRSAPYDAFFTMNFFEHVPRPNQALRALHNNLTDDGIGLIEVPNFDMMLKNNLFSEFVNDHLLYFTEETLASTLRMNGFEIVECKKIWYNYIISVVVRKRKRLDLSGFEHQRKKIAKELHEYISCYGQDKVAIYGAGHQALAVIAMADIGSHIAYVVDDAPFKQGKYTPATHIPIVSTEWLKTKPVDAIIVMAASYSDEVAAKLSSRTDLTADVSILREFGLEK